MDKFVIKLDKDTPSSCGKMTYKGLKIQKTLTSLKGVVVLEDIQKFKVQLTADESSHACICKILTKLQNKLSSRDILKTTGIGRVVHRLCRHEDLRISQLANKVYLKWKLHVIDVASSVPKEVMYNTETEDIRNSAKKWLSSALNLKTNHEIILKIEKELFLICKKLVGKNYRRNARKIYMKLKGNEELQTEIKNNCENNHLLNILLVKILSSKTV